MMMKTLLSLAMLGTVLMSTAQAASFNATETETLMRSDHIRVIKVAAKPSVEVNTIKRSDRVQVKKIVYSDVNRFTDRQQEKQRLLQRSDRITVNKSI